MKYKYFIKEIKVLKKVNALDEPIEYETTYTICRTHVWIWLAKLIPSMFAEYIWVANPKNAIESLNNSENVEIDWFSSSPYLISNRFKYIDEAEEFLKRMKTFPNQFYTKI